MISVRYPTEIFFEQTIIVFVYNIFKYFKLLKYVFKYYSLIWVDQFSKILKLEKVPQNTWFWTVNFRVFSRVFSRL